MRPDWLIKARGTIRAMRQHTRPAFTLLGKRFMQAVLSIFGASVLVWMLLPLAPGDPALKTLQAQGNDNPRRAEVEAMHAELKLDRPLVVQYFAWLTSAVQGDLSVSYQSGRPVLSEIARRLPATARLAGVALLLSIALSLVLALVAARYAGRTPDRITRALTQIGASMPSFLLGLLTLHFIVVGLGVGRVVAAGSIGDVWLPAVCLSIGRASDWAQLLRANLLEALGARYTLVATARGATRWRVLVRYALPNALLPFLTVVGVGIGSLLGGAAIIEAVFTYPGVGSYVVEAVRTRDLPVIQGFVIISVLTYITANFLVDVAALLVDPRLRTKATR